jgi:hypothetical protein
MAPQGSFDLWSISPRIPLWSCRTSAGARLRHSRVADEKRRRRGHRKKIGGY